MQRQTNEIDFREEKEGLFMERQTVQIFWTGGMDSTLRIVQLSQLEVNVLPVYIMRANGRKTAVEELTAMGKIYEILKADPRTNRCSIEAGTEESICFAGQSSSGHPVFWLEYHPSGGTVWGNDVICPW